MTKFEEALELIDEFCFALDLEERAVHGWTNKSYIEIHNEKEEAKKKLHEFLKTNLPD